MKLYMVYGLGAWQWRHSYIMLHITYFINKLNWLSTMRTFNWILWASNHIHPVCRPIYRGTRAHTHSHSECLCAISYADIFIAHTFFFVLCAFIAAISFDSVCCSVFRIIKFAILQHTIECEMAWWHERKLLRYVLVQLVCIACIPFNSNYIVLYIFKFRNEEMIIKFTTSVLCRVYRKLRESPAASCVVSHMCLMLNECA